MTHCDLCGRNTKHQNIYCSFQNGIKMIRCEVCDEIYHGLMNGNIDKDRIHDGVWILITYKVVKFNRGYKKTIHYPLLKEIENTNARIITRNNDYGITALYEKDDNNNIIYNIVKAEIL